MNLSDQLKKFKQFKSVSWIKRDNKNQSKTGGFKNSLKHVNQKLKKILDRSGGHTSQVNVKNVRDQFLKESRQGYLLPLIFSIIFVLSSVLVLWLGVWNYLLPQADYISARVIEGDAAASIMESLKLKSKEVKSKVDKSAKKLRSTSNKLASSHFSRMRVSDFVGTLESNGGNVKIFCIGVIKPGLQPCDVEKLSESNSSQAAKAPASTQKANSVYDELLNNKSLSSAYMTVGNFALEAAKSSEKISGAIGVEGVTLSFEVDPEYFFLARQALLSELPQLLILQESIELNAESGVAKVSLELAYPFASK